MLTGEPARHARLAALEAACLSMLRLAKEDGFDGIEISVQSDDGQQIIDVAYTVKRMPMGGHEL